MYEDVKIVIDLDGTICPIKSEGEKYIDLVPNEDIVEKMREYARQGAKITIFTSRNMRTYEGDVELIKENTVPVIKKWLDVHEIPYDELIVGKPWAGRVGLYVDDRAVRPDEFVEHDFEELVKICEKSARVGGKK